MGDLQPIGLDFRLDSTSLCVGTIQLISLLINSNFKIEVILYQRCFMISKLIFDRISIIHPINKHLMIPIYLLVQLVGIGLCRKYLNINIIEETYRLSMFLIFYLFILCPQDSILGIPRLFRCIIGFVMLFYPIPERVGYSDIICINHLLWKTPEETSHQETIKLANDIRNILLLLEMYKVVNDPYKSPKVDLLDERCWNCNGSLMQDKSHKLGCSHNLCESCYHVTRYLNGFNDDGSIVSNFSCTRCEKPLKMSYRLNVPSNPKMECFICTESIKEGDGYGLLYCIELEYSHLNCLKKWREAQNKVHQPFTCPTCRSKTLGGSVIVSDHRKIVLLD
jgi:hypothetical protein